MRKACPQCKKALVKRPHEWPYLFKQRRYCDLACVFKFKKGKNLPGTFQKGSQINLGRKRPDMIGARNFRWKRRPKYLAIHTWVARWRGKPNMCECCGRQTAGRGIHWANIDHRYRRVLGDYIRLCAKCHAFYDRTFNR